MWITAKLLAFKGFEKNYWGGDEALKHCHLRTLPMSSYCFRSGS